MKKYLAFFLTKVVQKILLTFIMSTYLVIAANAQSDSLAYYLNMSFEELLNVTITTSTKTEEHIENAPSVVTVISAKEIQAMGARELLDVLQIVPGFELSKNSSGNTLIGVRGVKDPRYSCKILMLQNGMPINEIYYSAAMNYGYQYDLNNIERIEIIRGPGSAMYGRNAFSAVINLITKTGKTDKGINAKAEIGNFNTYSGSLSYGYNKEEFNFRVSSWLIKSDVSDAMHPSRNELWAVNQNNQMYQADIQYKGLRISGTYLNQDMGDPIKMAEQKNKVGNYSIEFREEFSPKIKFQARLYGQNGYRVQDAYTVKPNSTLVNGMILKPCFREYIYGMDAETNFQLFDGNNLLLGIQGDAYGVKDAEIFSNFSFATGAVYPNVTHENLVKWEPGFVKNNGHDYNNIALYLQDIWYPTQKIGITVGARFDYENQIGGVFNPRLGFVWNFLPNTHLKLLYGEAYRSPTPNQQYATMGFALGNPDLKPERIHTFELALSYNTKKTTTQINAFHNQLHNMIYAERQITTDAARTLPNRNMAENLSVGLEFENKIFWNKNLYTFINYSYTHSENTDQFWNESEMIYDYVDVAPHKLNAGFNLSFLKKFNLNTYIFYRSKMSKYFTYNTQTKIITEVPKDPVGDYAILNTTLHLSNIIKGIELSASVYNLLNTKYYSQELAANVPEQGNRQFIVRIAYKL